MSYDHAFSVQHHVSLLCRAYINTSVFYDANAKFDSIISLIPMHVTYNARCTRIFLCDAPVMSYSALIAKLHTRELPIPSPHTSHVPDLMFI